MYESFSAAAQPLMEKLSYLFQSYPMLATYYTTVARWIFVALALFILIKSIASLLKAKNPSEIWAYLTLPDGSNKPLRHWENVLGRAKSADVVIDIMTVSRNHGTLCRDDAGQWRYNDLNSTGGSKINGVDIFDSTKVYAGDTITLGGVDCVLVPASLTEKIDNIETRKAFTTKFAPWSCLFALTVFQILACIQFIAAEGADLPAPVLFGFMIFTILMWAICIFLRVMQRTAFEMETIAFFLCTLNLCVVATACPEEMMKQLFAIIVGLGLFFGLCWYLRDLDRGLKIRKLLVILGAVLLLTNLVFGSNEFGATNWIRVAGMSIQPSELVKIAFIFIGSATLDELYEKKNLTLFVVFSAFCLGCLAVMGDFGTAAIFFVTFVVISFLRSGEFSKLVLIGAASVLGILFIIRFKPYIAARFTTCFHAWDSPDDLGFQQTRAMSSGASGGLFGMGGGDGWFHTITASDTDLVFSLLSEEWGLIIAVLAVVSIITLGVFAVRSIMAGRSTFYTIAACAATSLFIFQTALNVLGSLNILPFTGVTMPFVSNGGTSMMASWGLLAFLKAADTRQNASIAVRAASDEDELEGGSL